MAAAPPVLLQHPSSLDHDTGPHPEQPARIVAIDRELEARGWLGFERVSSPAVERSVLEAVHPPRHIELIERMAASGGARIDADTVVSAGSFTAALHACGGAVSLVDRLVSGSAPTGFSIHRPPGHHAEAGRAMGFCLFNSVAVAAQHALDAHGLERVMVLDWDVHHGNGTNDIFHAEPRVLYCSIHQSPLYPGTGPASDVGSGPGRGFTVNLPVAPGSGDREFRSLVDHVAVPLARLYAPQLLLISAGFDAHAEDPLAECRVTADGYGEMARSLRGVAGELGVPVGAVLEGGYALDALALSVAVTMGVLGGVDIADGAVGVADVSGRALTRLAEFWPGLA
ncbi:MAG TPA: histone deacetylase, partial [Solirubrobacteraceae bacterium]|jgi:acetoin utilization deacetylase AcuC-like enzyme